MVIDNTLDIYTYLNKLLNIKDITNLLETKKVYYTKITDTITKNALVYYILREKKGFSEDNCETITKYTIQIDLYSNSNFTELLNQIKKQMVKNDIEKDEIIEGFDKEFKYHKILRYTLYLNN